MSSTAGAGRIAEVLDNAWAPATRAKYDNSVSIYLRWCQDQGIPRHNWLPASEINLCSFVAHLAGSMAGSTIRSHLSGLKRWHILANYDYQLSPRLKYLLKGADNMTPDSSKQPPRPPITLAMIRALHRSLDLSTEFDVCVFATATVAFWGQSRLGELLSSSAKAFDPSKIPTVENGGIRGEHIYICRQNGRSDPITAIERHITINELTPHLPLFSYAIGDGRHLALTKDKFLARCNEIWTMYGWPRMTGHSFRIGGTTKLLVAGVPPDVVRAMGRWSSDAFLRYWRSLELIAPKYVEYIEGT
ncbi:hypothetical protein BD779DRAFT_1611783 [Infundibulicybe gibba]|nr:hypothetical protein BD779DRAFT_1611783 [Infundibulicybe gibba]